MVAGRGGVINSRALGRWLAANKKRIVAGRTFEDWGLVDGVATWKLCVSPASERSSEERRELKHLLVH